MWRVYCVGKTWAVHRIILLINGYNISGKIVDHIDGNPFNNIISNLNITTQKDNTHNTRKGSNNSTGVTGVSKGTNGTNSTYFIAFWQKDGKLQCKRFCIEKLGYNEAFELACNYRKQMIEELNNSGENYTGRHGL